MEASTIFGIIIIFLALYIAFAVKPIRKAIGLVLVIVGTIFSLTGIGLIIGVPMIFIGGLMLFIK